MNSVDIINIIAKCCVHNNNVIIIMKLIMNIINNIVARCTVQLVQCSYAQRHILYSVVYEILSSYEYEDYLYMTLTVI